jgi:NitT/TauT family transport system permease protein
VFFIVFFNAFQGVREVNPNLVANVKVLGASPLQVARHVTIPSALTWIIASLHTAFGFAIIGALVGEVLGSQRGIGLVISQAQGRLDPNTVFAGMAIMAVVTLAAEYLISLLESRVLSWRPPSHSESAGI